MLSAELLNQEYGLLEGFFCLLFSLIVEKVEAIKKLKLHGITEITTDISLKQFFIFSAGNVQNKWNRILTKTLDPEK